MKLFLKLYDIGDIYPMLYDIVQTPNIILAQCQTL